MSTRGRSTLDAWEQRLLDQRESVQVTARCAWCPWELAGTVLETREAHAQHRARIHPDVRVKPRAKRRRPYRTMVSETTLEDNIANARAQGAAGWAGPE